MIVEIRKNSVLIEGYVNAVLRDSKPIPSRTGSFIERIMPGAFSRSLERNGNVDIMLNHQRVLSSTGEGFELYEDSIGLRARGEIKDPEVLEKARAKKLRGWSFGFIPKEERSEVREGVEHRDVHELDLIEASIVDDRSIPAYIATSIECRDNQTIIKEYRMEPGIEYRTEEKAEETPLFDYTEYRNRINALKEAQK